MKVHAKLSIGYPSAMREENLEIEDSALEGLTEDEKDEYINKEVRIWANDFIETWYEKG